MLKNVEKYYEDYRYNSSLNVQSELDIKLIDLEELI